jgi:alpha-beta hydrolase superfamily lysophospholipase
MRRRRPTAKGLLASVVAGLLLAGVVFGGACALFVRYERAFVFHRMQRASVSPAAAKLDGFREVSIPTADGEHLYGWWRPPDPGHGVIVFLTGSGVVVSDYAGLFGDLAAHGFGVASADYRGSGASTGSPSEAGLRADADAVFDFARAAAPDARIAVFGQSMGTWPAVRLALDRPAVGVLLDSPYASVARLFEQHGIRVLLRLKLPFRQLMAGPLDAEALIGGLHVPVLIVHGTDDSAIPLAEARRLFAAAHVPKTMIEVAGAAHAQTWSGPTRDRELAALAAWTSP